MFRPQLGTCLKSYSKQQFLSDLLAGSVVGIVALPLAMAFAIASGVSPEKGLYTAIIAGFLISALGGSRVQIGGLLAHSSGSFLTLSAATASMA
jgi:SulP family sulfate permease